MKKFILLTMCVYSKLMPSAVMVQSEQERAAANQAAAKRAEVERLRQWQANQAAAHRSV